MVTGYPASKELDSITVPAPDSFDLEAGSPGLGTTKGGQSSAFIVPDPDERPCDKGPAGDSTRVAEAALPDTRQQLPTAQKVSRWLTLCGVELRGITPVTIEERTDKSVLKTFFLWFTMCCNLLPITVGMESTMSMGLGLRDASLVILFFNILCALPVAYISTLGPKTGLRQMILARYSFGYYLVNVVVLVNLATLTGFVVVDNVVGGQILAVVNPGSISVRVGIVIIALITLVISFFGYKVLHQYERYSWIPILISIIVATGCSGKELHDQGEPPKAGASNVFTTGSLIGGFSLTLSAMSSDFFVYLSPNVSSVKIFAYTLIGVCLPTIPLMALGAAIGRAVINIPSWNAAYQQSSTGGIFAAMLAPAGNFGKFLLVLLSFSAVGNVAATIYSITLNFQLLLPVLVWVPRAVFAIVFTAISIPVSIRAATSFFDSLQNFVGIISYWGAAFIGVTVTEHWLFRRGRCETYDHAMWNVPRRLPSGVPALAAGVLCFALVIPCMDQTWFVGPIAKTTGDIGFEMAFAVTVLLYVPMRMVEIRLRGR